MDAATEARHPLPVHIRAMLHAGWASVLTLTAAGRRTLTDVTTRAGDRLEWTPEEIAAFTALMRRFSADLMSRYDQPLEAAR